MTGGVLTLPARRRARLAEIAAALSHIDAALTTHAGATGGRFIRFGSTATGAYGPESDVDIIADYPGDRAAIDACTVADAVCAAHGLPADCRPACWVSARVMDRAIAEGVVLP